MLLLENLRARGLVRPAGDISRIGYTRNLKSDMVVTTNKLNEFRNDEHDFINDLKISCLYH